MDDLQTLWRKGQPQEMRLPSAQIEKIIGQKSTNEFERFKRLLGWEIAINTPLTAGIIYWIAVSELASIPFFLASFILLGIGYFVWQCVFYHQMQRHQPSNDVSDYVKKGLAILKRFVWHFKMIMAGSIILGFSLSFLVGYYNSEIMKNSALIYVENPFWNLVLALGIVVVMLLIIHFYIKHLYQAKINRMQRLLDDLEETE